MTDLERLYNKCAETYEGCWEFLGCRDAQGYGRMWYINAVIMAHRASWLMHKGPIPNGLFVLHKCDNPCCVNPEHLFIGTASDNTSDMMNKGRHGTRSGPNANNAVLTEAEAREIKRLLKEGAPRIELSKRFLVSLGAIDNIKHGRTWSNLQ